MSTGISNLMQRAAWKRAVLCPVFCLGLGACAGGDGFSFAAAPESGAAADAQADPVLQKSTEAVLARGAITLVSPKGYCIEDQSVTTTLSGSMARLAACTSLDGKGAGRNAAVMLVNVSEQKPGEISAPSISDLTEVVAPAPVVRSEQRGALALVQVAEGGSAVFAPADPQHWRAATVLDNRLVLLSLYAPKGSELTGAAGSALLQDLAKGLSAKRLPILSRLTRGTPAPEESGGDVESSADPAAEADKTGEDADRRFGFGLGALASRVFNQSNSR